MKAFICTNYGPPEVLKLRDVKTPSPNPDEVRIKIHATAITGSDIIIRSAKVSKAFWLPMRIALGFRRPRNPILGMIFAGEIDATGSAVTIFRKGDKVFGSTLKTPSEPRCGTYAEYKCLPENSQIAPMPSTLTYEEAAAIPYGGSLALYFVNKAEIKRGQKALIYGASGSVGSSAVQLARHFGASVTGVCSTANMEWVKSLGADTVIDYMKEDFTKRNESYEFIFDAVPSGKINRKDLKKKCLKSLSPNGRYFSVDDGRPETGLEGLKFLKELVETGEIKPVIDRRYPFEQIPEAHAYVEQGHKKGNVVITITGSEKPGIMRA
jgi:NADPH:quinone reductase-like Zn-dependent oxidoreductase